MTYLEFHKQWKELGCFSIHQIYAWDSGFNRLNINAWIHKGLIVKLRKGWYAFSEFLNVPDFYRYIANRIYSPSYISLHSALSHYGMIPEGIIAVTSVTSLKTVSFSNRFGEYSYQSVKPELMFGYRPLRLHDGRALLIATPEKALLDLLYLYPFYRSETDMLDLRLDEDFMQDELDKEKFMDFASKIGSTALDKRISTLFKAYDL